MKVARAFRNLDRHGQHRAPEVIEEEVRQLAPHLKRFSDDLVRLHRRRARVVSIQECSSSTSPTRCCCSRISLPTTAGPIPRAKPTDMKRHGRCIARWLIFRRSGGAFWIGCSSQARRRPRQQQRSARTRPRSPGSRRTGFLRAKLIEAGVAGETIETANLEKEIARTVRLPQPILGRRRIVVAMQGEAAILSDTEISPDLPRGDVE